MVEEINEQQKKKNVVFRIGPKIYAFIGYFVVFGGIAMLVLPALITNYIKARIKEGEWGNPEEYMAFNSTDESLLETIETVFKETTEQEM